MADNGIMDHAGDAIVSLSKNFQVDGFGDLRDAHLRNGIFADPIRKKYCWAFSEICTGAQLRSTIREIQKKWSSNPPVFFSLSPGNFARVKFSLAAILSDLSEILKEIRAGSRFHFSINLQDTNCRCRTSGQRIPTVHER